MAPFGNNGCLADGEPQCATARRPRATRKRLCPQSPPGEATNQQLSDAISGTSANTNAVQLLDPNVDLPTVVAKLNELIQAQRR
ncbi:MAG: hypothetical protein WA117_25710 [Verrucomicrobiia bacterium]